jgi:hypothetical protein
MNARWERGLVVAGRLQPTMPTLETLRHSRVWEAMLLLVGLAAFTVTLGPALRESGTPPGWDQANHLKDSLVFERLYLHPERMTPTVFRAILKGSEEYPLVTPSGYYPPLVPAVTGLLYLAAGRSYETAMATNLLFLGLLIWGVWGLGSHFAGRPAGVMAALLVLAAPGIRLAAAEYMLDLPLACLVVLACWACVLTQEFTHRNRSIVFGILCGLGMLTKWSFFLFLLSPVVLTMTEGMRKAAASAVGRRARLQNLGWALLAAALVCAPYYAPIFTILIRKTWVHAGGAADGFSTPFSIDSALFHLLALPRKLFGWPLTCAALGGILAAMGAREVSRRAVRFLLLWAASLYLIFTFLIVNKQSRYLLPWLPVLLMIAALGVVDLFRREGMATKMAAVLILALAMLGLRGSWYVPPTADWKMAEVADLLERDLSQRAVPRAGWKLGVIPDMREVNGPTLGYYVSRLNLPVSVIQLVNRMKRHVAMEVGLDPFGRGDFYQTFDDYDYVLTKTGNNAVPPWEAVVPQMMEYFDARRAEFVEVASLQVPDGSEVSLFRRKDR